MKLLTIKSQDDLENLWSIIEYDNGYITFEYKGNAGEYKNTMYSPESRMLYGIENYDLDIDDLLLLTTFLTNKSKYLTDDVIENIINLSYTLYIDYEY